MKKAPIAVALLLVGGLLAAAFSLAPAVAQYTLPSDSIGASSAKNTTSTSNTTSTANATGEGTLSARGSIAALIFNTGEITTTSEAQNGTTSAASNDTSITAGNATTDTTTSLSDNTTMTLPQTMTGLNSTSSSNMTSTATSNETSTAQEKDPYILSGDWNLDVRNGKVTDFAANFTMVHVDGTSRHTHDLSNFVQSNSTTIDNSAGGTSYIFGTVDVAADGENKWTNVKALIMIQKNNVVIISLASEDTEDHFMGAPIYGIVDSMTDKNGNEMIETGGTQTAGNVTSGGNVTQGIKDFFNRTGK